MITKTKIQSIFRCVPEKFKGKLLPFFGFSLVNALLDLLSVAYLLPFLVLALDRNRTFQNEYLNLFFQKENLAYSILLLIGFFILKNALNIWFINYQNKLIFAVSSEISKNYTERFIHSDYLFYQNQDKGAILKNTIEVPNNFANHVLLSLNTLLSEGCIILGISCVGLYLFPTITCIALVLFLLTFSLIYTFRRFKKVRKSLSEDYQNNVNYLLDLINGFFEIKSAGKEDAFLDKFNSSNRKLNKTYSFLTTLKNSNAKYLEIAIIVIIGVIVFYLVNYSGETTTNVMLLSFFASVFFKLIPSLNRLIVASSSLKSFEYTITSIEKNSSKKDVKTIHASEVLFKSHLNIENISFSYDAEHPLIENTNLKIYKGEIVGIFGRSGSGKTTLLNILLNLIEPDLGKITLDEKEITRENKNAFLKLVGYVTQEPYVFNGTLLENVAIGEKQNQVDFYRIQELCEQIGFEDVIHNFEHGWHASTGNGGQKLSGGQKQKLALIRALYNQPKLLILDEATNQLDQENEEKILSYLKKLSEDENLTVLLISHDQKVLTFCDKTFEFKKGSLHEV
ncbi:ABC transporter ATP-binding protein/permease [Flavobacterium sp. SM15]|uniref:ATP-binding cassette domain-containing protein n=1 Tax=Flavobacterium sp. SM15 TaxID=2908005 RepID=UPI001EDAB245|nr:ABC transporter ATP-binding protein [Flavobacterium sp. SM15]MCG2610860.1 ABC transporter ATP-binding protein/permease [Flavobacterium sp. SM15]